MLSVPPLCGVPNLPHHALTVDVVVVVTEVVVLVEVLVVLVVEVWVELVVEVWVVLVVEVVEVLVVHEAITIAKTTIRLSDNQSNFALMTPPPFI